MCFIFLQYFDNRELSLFYRKAAIKFLTKRSFIYSFVVSRETQQRKSHPKAIKQELLASIIKIANEEDYSGLNEVVKNMKESKKAISIIKKYEKLPIGENRKIINIVGKQGELL